MAEQESNFTPDAVGQVGERGLLQIRPETALQNGLNAEQLWDADYNIRAAAMILRDLLAKSGGDPRAATAAYNSGLGAHYGGAAAEHVRAVWERIKKYQGYACP
jgi:membrane-bound lytic murein transglycosylase F